MVLSERARDIGFYTGVVGTCIGVGLMILAPKFIVEESKGRVTEYQRFEQK